jgi:hypothetical protein
MSTSGPKFNVCCENRMKQVNKFRSKIQGLKCYNKWNLKLPLYYKWTKFSRWQTRRQEGGRSSISNEAKFASFQILRRFGKAKFRKATIRFVMSVCPSTWNNLAPTGRISMKLHIWAFFENLSRTSKFNYNRTRMTGTLHEDQCTFFVIPRPVLLRKRNVSDDSCRENQNTDFMFNNVF